MKLFINSLVLFLLTPFMGFAQYAGYPTDYSKPYQLPFSKNNEIMSIPAVISAGDSVLMVFYSSSTTNDTIYTHSSSDGGIIWSSRRVVGIVQKNSNTGFLSFSGISANDGRIILSYSLINVGGSSPTKIIYSDDGGDSWSEPANIIGTVYIQNPVFTKSPEGRIYISSYGNYFFYSSDNGATWKSKNIGSPHMALLATDTLNLSVYSTNINVIYQKKSSDGGSTWLPSETILSSPFFIERLRAIRDDSGNSYLFYQVRKPADFNILQDDINYIKSNDDGLNWSEETQLTYFVNNDKNISVTNWDGYPYLIFTSNRWTGLNNIWAAKISTTEDTSPPATIYYFVPQKIGSIFHLAAYAGDEQGVRDINVSLTRNNIPLSDVNMYDDGFHLDSLAGDNKFGTMLINNNPGDRVDFSFFIVDDERNAAELKGGTFVFSPQLRNVWMNAGSFVNWYSSMGMEVEEGIEPNQQSGARYSALYKNQDMQASKGLWLGAADFTDESGNFYPNKVVHCGPRVKGENEFFPVKLEVINKFTPPSIVVNGVSSSLYPAEYDSIDANLLPERMILNEVNTQLGLTMERKIMQFSSLEHDNYIITEYKFTNTGNTNGDGIIELPGNTLNGVMIYFLNRYAINRDSRYVIGNATGWGINTMIDGRGDGVLPDPAGENFRTQFAWHGRYSQFNTYDNIGAPIWQPALPYNLPGDTVGRLSAAQFIGTLTLHADQSASITADDPGQPATTSYLDSDSPITVNNDPYNIPKMVSEYTEMTRGHRSPRHAWAVEPSGDFANAANDAGLGSSGGFSAATGYGPYNVAPGEDITIVIAEGAAGLSRSECLRIGREYKEGTIDRIAKNIAVLTGKDSLMKTWTNAASNYASGYNISEPPFPPAEFRILSKNPAINLTWVSASGNSSEYYRIYRRADRADSVFKMIFETEPGIYAFDDENASPDENYFYYIVTVGVNGGTSNPIYTVTSVPVNVLTSLKQNPEKPGIYSLSQNYPNPFNPNTRINFSLPSAGNVSIKVYDILGREMKTLISGWKNAGTFSVDFNASDLASGIYFLEMRTGGFSERIKMNLVK